MEKRLTKFEIMKEWLDIKKQYFPTMNRSKFMQIMGDWIRDPDFEEDRMVGEHIVDYAKKK